MAYIIMSDSFVRLCEITTHKSILWHELYLDPTGGDFQMELAADKYLPFTRKGYYIINTDSEKFGIIDTYEVKETAEDGLVLTVSGLMGESILQRRVIWPTISMSGSVNDVVAAIIRRNVTEPANASRRIDNFAYVSNAAFSSRVSKQITGATVADACCSICGQFGWGYVVSINDTMDGFTMKLIAGTDRSATQADNPVIVFSAADFGISEFTYLTSEKAVFSHVICAGEGTGASRTAVIYPSYSTAGNRGLNRREVFLDKRDVSREATEDGTLTEESYLEKLEYEAAEKLKESATSEACEGIVRPYRYRLYEDFLPGDIVTVRNERLGMEYDIRVLGALISIDENGARDITAEMGNLVVADIQDEPEEDVVEEEAEEPTIDPTTVSLRNDIRPFSFAYQLLDPEDDFGNPTGWLHICDNQKAEFAFSVGANYVAKTGTYNGATFFRITFTLTPEQYAVIGKQLEVELNEISFPALLELAADSSYIPCRITFKRNSTAYSEETGLYTVTIFAVFNNVSVLDTYGTTSTFKLMVSGTRTIAIPEPAKTFDIFLQGSTLRNITAPEGYDPATIIDETRKYGLISASKQSWWSQNGENEQTGSYGATHIYRITGEVDGVYQTEYYKQNTASNISASYNYLYVWVVTPEVAENVYYNNGMSAALKGCSPDYSILKAQSSEGNASNFDWLLTCPSNVWKYTDKDICAVKEADIIYDGVAYRIKVLEYPHELSNPNMETTT